MRNIFYSHLKPLPQSVTSYDILKTIALMLMLIDHIGYYFLPDNETLRAIGRLCVPVWAFLIGYSLSDKKDPRLVAGTLILAINAYICGDLIVPLTILFTFFLCRVCMPLIQRVATTDYEKCIGIVILLALLALPTQFAFQYGTQIFLFALAGRFLKLRQQNKADVSRYYPIILLTVANIVYGLLQLIIFNFSYMSIAILVIGQFVVSVFLMKFMLKHYNLSKTLEFFKLDKALMFCGRWTLELYVLNIVSFSVISNMLGIGERDWFSFVLP